MLFNVCLVLPRTEVLAGICLGLLTYKPQYGLLFPLVLVARGEWKVFVAAAITAISVALASMLVFGAESWAAFFHWMPMISKAVLSEGGILAEAPERVRDGALSWR
ncbi:glycosyltransferase family 87 protein [Bradyrhizobium sp. CB82]|uniref:glycosyltransferase family 87 protein n=1 Tax=Bradyrhizobium sp. CB82 TaxID=3039159 RepID=UPI0024B0F10E|nr:glycosyltransferase family 87 protein [Bradyrhizobium sp. CB82]WFU41922.1 glycosyltransferase family 87 protein [Bradyrhizobium sp. CB82]